MTIRDALEAREGVQLPPPLGWSEIAPTLPEKPGPEREAKIIELVLGSSLLPIDWISVISENSTHCVKIYVPADALKLGTPEDNCRFNVTATGAQQLCDAMNLVMPTSKIMDLVYKQATKVITPCTQNPDSQMAYTSRMTQHSQAVDKKADGHVGLLDTVGKYWILTNKLVGQKDKAANFGWHVTSGQYRSPGGLYVLQPVGLAHDRWHVDYSQIFRPVWHLALVDNEEMPLVDVMTNPELAPLVSDEGTMKLTRMTDVENIYAA